MSGLQKMPWIAMFSAGDETPSTSTMFWPTKAMRSRPVQRPLEKHGPLEWLVALTARVVSMSIQTWDGGVHSTSDVESHCLSNFGTVANCRERNWILSGTFSQWSTWRSGVTCSDFLAENTSRAAALNTGCSRRCSVPDTPASTEQQ